MGPNAWIKVSDFTCEFFSSVLFTSASLVLMSHVQGYYVILVG